MFFQYYNDMDWDQLLSSEMHPINLILNHPEIHISIGIGPTKRFYVHWIRSRKSCCPLKIVSQREHHRTTLSIFAVIPDPEVVVAKRWSIVILITHQLTVFDGDYLLLDVHLQHKYLFVPIVDPFRPSIPLVISKCSDGLSKFCSCKHECVFDIVAVLVECCCFETVLRCSEYQLKLSRLVVKRILNIFDVLLNVIFHL